MSSTVDQWGPGLDARPPLALQADLPGLCHSIGPIMISDLRQTGGAHPALVVVARAERRAEEAFAHVVDAPSVDVRVGIAGEPGTDGHAAPRPQPARRALEELW